MGFPDVQWEAYFSSETPDDTGSAEQRRRELEMMMRQLREVSSEASS
jgi:hypothetical protein